MDDLISRQQAIDECYPITVDGEVYEVVQIETLMGLPSAQPESRWIPCSERLPEDNTRVQVTFANGEVGQSSWHKENEYNNGFDAVMHGVTDRHFVTFGVIAWMPLPEPYQGGEQE